MIVNFQSEQYFSLTQISNETNQPTEQAAGSGSHEWAFIPVMTVEPHAAEGSTTVYPALRYCICMPLSVNRYAANFPEPPCSAGISNLCFGRCFAPLSEPVQLGRYVTPTLLCTKKNNMCDDDDQHSTS